MEQLLLAAGRVLAAVGGVACAAYGVVSLVAIVTTPYPVTDAMVLKAIGSVYALVMHAAVFVAFGQVMGRESPPPPRAS